MLHYPNETYLSKQFKQVTGITPTQYKAYIKNPQTISYFNGNGEKITKMVPVANAKIILFGRT